jgi:hypothetical protein
MPLLERWASWAKADAAARGLHDVAPLIDGVAASLARLRSVDWQALLSSSGSSEPDKPSR